MNRLAFSVLVASIVGAPTIAAPPAHDEAKPPAAAPSPAPLAKDAEPQKRPPLLREGSFIARANGALRLVKPRGEWIFVPSAVDASGLERELIALPNETLAEAIRTAQLAPSPIHFEVSGEIFIYRGKNYLLLSMVTPIVEFERPAEAPKAAAPNKDKDGAKATPPPSEEDKIASELERKLAERIGTLPKTPTSIAGGEARGADTKGAEQAAKRTVLPEAHIQSRRGHLVRDGATGGWRFVFDGQLPDGGEPSMMLLPCLLLERVEKLARETEGPGAIIVSGATTSFEGRTFLMPTSFRFAQGGKGINP